MSSNDSRPIKVVHIVLSLEAGGMENGLANLANNIPPALIDNHFICLERMGSFVKRFPDQSKIHLLNKKPGRDLLSVFKLAHLLSKLDPDIIHTHNLGTLIYAALARGLRFSLRLLHGEHGQPPEPPTDQKRRFQRRLLYSICTYLHTVSRSLKDHFAHMGYSTNRMLVLKNGVDTKRFRPADRSEARKQLGIPESGFYLGIIGRFGPYKRHLEMLEAFERLAKENSQVHLLLAGAGGPLEKEVNRRIESCPYKNRIHALGLLADPRPAYHALDLLVIPSINEGLANTLLEAMASGIPVLTNSMACGPEEVITNNVDGFIRRMEFPEEISNEVDSILEKSDELVSIANEALTTITEKWSIQAMTKSYVKTYQFMTEESPEIQRFL